MISYIQNEYVFQRLLSALNVESNYRQTHKGFRTVDKSKDFELVEETGCILFRQNGVELDGDTYKKTTKIFQYFIKEDMGNILVLDENNRKVLVLTNQHDILRIQKTKAKFNFQKEVSA